jgi:hypothetical protein
MNVLFFGDSHTQYYINLEASKIQNEIKFDVCCVMGATAQGAVNPNSKTQALATFRKHLEIKKANDYDYFAIMLGEVDCGFVMWYRAKKYNKTIQEQIKLSVNNLEKFLKKDAEKVFLRNKIVVVGATLPTIKDNTDRCFLHGARSEVDASLRERIDCTLEYNEQLAIMAKKNNYRYFDISNETFDQENYCVFSQFLHKDPHNHHFDEHSVAPIFVDKFKEL